MSFKFWPGWCSNFIQFLDTYQIYDWWRPVIEIWRLAIHTFCRADHGIIHGRFLPPEIFLSPLFKYNLQHHFKKKLSHQIQRRLCINCERAFVSEVTYPLKSSNVSGEGSDILFMKIKMKYPTGQNLEIMTFRYLKTLLFDKFFKKLQHYLMFLFLKSIIRDN